MKVTPQIAETIIKMAETNSYTEIAKAVDCSVATVGKVLRDNNVVRSKNVKSRVRSRVRTDLVRAERRRVLFGLEQKSELKVFKNQTRNTLKYCLRRKNYIFLNRGDNTAYYSDETRRDTTYEERGVKLGMKFMPLPVAETTDCNINQI